MKYGYARVSSKGQDYAGQVEPHWKPQGASGYSVRRSQANQPTAGPNLKSSSGLLARRHHRSRPSSTGWPALAETSTTSFMSLARTRMRLCLTGRSWCDTTTSRPPDDDRYGRDRRVRARTDPGTLRRGYRTRQAQRHQVRSPLALDPSQRRRIAERYTAGETMAELAREYECGEATIWRALQ